MKFFQLLPKSLLHFDCNSPATNPARCQTPLTPKTFVDKERWFNVF